MSIAARSAPDASAACRDMHARAALAALECWDIRHRSVILLDSDLPGGGELRRVLMGMGLDVFHGPHAAGAVGRPLLLFAAENRGRSELAARLDAARSVHPSAPVCVVTGLLPVSPSDAGPCAGLYDDGRALLQAAGIGFLSEMELCNAPAA
jgi:hypothetical protein